MDSVSFDRAADRYEQTRGGTERGQRFAPTLVEQLEPGSRLLEIGVGTGAIGGPLAERGHRVVGIDPGHGLVHQGDRLTAPYRFEESPNEAAARIESRDWSSLWDLDDQTWAQLVQPVIEAMAALPDPDRPRTCVHRHVCSVYRRS